MSLLKKSLILFAMLSFAMASKAADHYVSPSGQPSGDGSINNPWDIKTALAQPAAVQAGDTIWLRGGRYSDPTGYTSSLNGTSSSPIVVRNYNGEHAAIDVHGTSGFLLYGSYAWFWGIEIADFEESPTANPAVAALGVGIYGPGIKCINMVVHDTAQGFSGYNAAPNSEIYGNLIYYNGFVSSSRNAGHGIYLQNVNGTKVVSDNFVGDNADEGIQIYGSGSADIVGFDIEGNALYNTSSWPVVNYQYNTIIAGGQTRKNITFSNNFSYFPLSSGLGFMAFGQYTAGQDITIQNNVFAGGYQGVEVSYESGPVVFTGNKLVAANASLRMVLLDNFPAYSAYTWNNNAYYDQTNYHFYVDPTGKGGMYLSFAAWKNTSGFDAASTYQNTLPTGAWVYVRPNKYESKRGNITIYNWDQKQSVAVDLSGVLSTGDQFVIQDAQNFYGPAVVSGTYNGTPVTVPMSNLVKAAGIGFTAPMHTAPQFGTFVVMPAKSGSQPAPPTNLTVDVS